MDIESRTQSLLLTLLTSLILLTGCAAETEVFTPGGIDPSENSATNNSTGDDAAHGDPDDAGGADAGSEEDASMQPDAEPPVEPPVDCGCPLGDGPYCGARATALAADAGCALDPLVTRDDMLYGCESGVWTEIEACSGECQFDETSSLLDDLCVLPECECFVQVAWCGSGAAKEARDRGCKIPLLPAHRGDILHCPGGEWAVKQTCDDGCVEAPAGTPDVCKGESEYLLPLKCPAVANCTNGNNTGTHTGKDHYAYDFGMPIGTNVVAFRSGRVFRVRNVSGPGSACYTGGSTSCANYANTVEIKHDDGTIGLYMHLQRGTVTVGDRIQQGQKIGVSGNSGWSTGPHTHVQVQSNCGSWWCQSIPFRFGERASITRGTSIVSQNCGP